MAEPTSDYTNQDRGQDPSHDRRRSGDPLTPKRAELIKRISAATKAGEPTPALLKEIALFLAYGGGASDTDAVMVTADLSTANEEAVRTKLIELGWTPPSEDPLKSWLGNGLNEKSAETGYTLRRESRSFDTGPRKVEVCDWASSAGKIHSAMRHLDEALPGGQRRRTQLAILQMDQGLAELKVWLRDAGVLP